MKQNPRVMSPDELAALIDNPPLFEGLQSAAAGAGIYVGDLIAELIDSGQLVELIGEGEGAP